MALDAIYSWTPSSPHTEVARHERIVAAGDLTDGDVIDVMEKVDECAMRHLDLSATGEAITPAILDPLIEKSPHLKSIVYPEGFVEVMAHGIPRASPLLILAMYKGTYEQAEAFLSSLDPSDLVTADIAIEEGNEDILRFYLEHGNRAVRRRLCGSLDNSENTLLHRVSSQALIDALVACGINPRKENRVRETPVIAAIKRDDGEAIRSLSKHIIDLDEQNSFGVSPSELLTDGDYPNALEAFQSLGYDVSPQNVAQT